MKITIFLLMITLSLFAEIKELTLKQAIKIALENNKQSKISKVALQIAQAQYEQALSANYPALNAMIVGRRFDEDRIFKLRGNISLPSNLTKTLALANTLKISDSAIRNGTQNKIASTPDNAFPQGNLYTEIDSIVQGRDTIKSSLKILYPLFTGGKITSIIEQAKLNKLLATNKIKRDEINVIFDIKKYFYGYVLTKELYKIVNGTLKRMEFIEEMTKQFYESGESLKVKKTDYLEIQVVVTLIKSLVAKIEENKKIVKSALANSMGLSWDSEIEPKYSDNTLLPPNYILNDLIKQAYKTNSDITKVDIALKISKEQIKEKKSGHYPTVALQGEVSNIYNSYDYGVLNKEQRNSWNIGFMINLPIFDGFKTTNMVKEKKLQRKKMYLIQDMLKQGVALLIKNELTKASIGFKQIQTLKKSKKLAIANRKLNVKGFQIDAIEPEKVIQSQYIEAYVKADYLKYVHDYLLSLATIDKLIGKELVK